MPAKREPDFILMACTSASVSYRELLTKEELVHALLSGEVPQNRRAHLLTLLEEALETLLKGLVGQVSGSRMPGEVQKNLLKMAETLDATHHIRERVASIWALPKAAGRG